MKNKKENLATAEQWQERFTRAESNQQNLFQKVSKFYDIMYAVQSTTNIAPWRAKIYVPIMASKAWDLVSRLSSVLPYFRTRLNGMMEYDDEEDEIVLKEEARERQQRIDSKLQYDYQYTKDEPMKLKVFDTMIDAVVAGTGWAKAGWSYKKEEIYSREYDEKGMIDDMSKEKVKEYPRGCNTFEPVNFFNVFLSDNSTSFGKTKYQIVRYFKSIDDLKADPSLDQSKVDLLNTSEDRGDFDLYNQARNRLVNQHKVDSDETVPTATIFECYERKPSGLYCSVYGIGKANKNGWVQLQAPVRKYWHNQFPVQPFYIRRKSFSPWGESLFENNSSLQYATNDLFNHYLDNWNLSIDSMLLYEDGTLTSDFIVKPGGEIAYTGEKPDTLKFPEPNPAQLSMVMGVIDKAVENATVPQYLSGVPNSSIDKTAGTAKGIGMITEAATEKIGYMRDNFKQSMTMIGKMWLSNLKQYQDRPEEIRTYERGKEKPDIILPQDYDGDWDLSIDDDSLVPMTKEEKREALQKFATEAQLIQKAAIEQAAVLQTKEFIPKVNYAEILEEAAQFYTVKDPNRFVVNDDQNAEAPANSPMEQEDLLGLAGGSPRAAGDGQGGTGQDAGVAAQQGQQGAAYGGQSSSTLG